MNLICGINPVLEALAAGTRHFDRLLIAKGLRSRRLSEAIRRATHLGIPLRFEMRETLDRMAGGVPHQGVIAVVSEKPVLSLESLLEEVHPPALVVVLDGVEDPRNLGAILRTAEAAGAGGVVLPERHSAGLSETVARASAGALEHVPVARVGNLVQALEELKARGVWVVGLDASGHERWDAVDLTRPVALVLGGEGHGIRRLVREHCDHLVSIPHFGHVASLNVSVAAGIALYEAVRQRRAVPSLVRPIPARPAPAPRIIGPAPDDTEADPGARPPLPVDAYHLEPDGDEPEGDETPVPVTHLDPHEDVAWGQGPTILKPVGFNQARRPNGRRGRGRRRPGGGRPPLREQPQGPPPGDPGAPAGPPPRRKGRRRRGRREAGAPGGPPRREPGAPGGDGDASSSERSPVEGPSVPPSQDERPAAGARRRRRRRRRH
ncbi:MAG TPA: 23S rRNA (guanosine(2251)-2'-O)-methyltransferase RlmB [Vicinamibacteria bacterium]|nr:23S rRNA (guanosine(2251)-2'-O)-methyltransferase RlmB [Vicinamibacteria bacterium]